ncbi:neuronal acetylcholine receptor subunit alpha-7-like [Amphiura filiformis]|uniref:neuronal acetylcholine receptor subunit alpha-7-like n=1 Tax=Amphiura filiformis TaxID=82378 RepID=UPI003B218FBC
MKYYKIQFTICILISLLPANDGSCISSATHKCLVEELLGKYGPPFTRPVKQYNKTVDVYIFMFLKQIIDLNEHDQLLKIAAVVELHWTDEFLTWNTTEYPEVTALHIPMTNIWRPDIYIWERIQSDDMVKSVPLISPDGNVYWSYQSYITTACKIDARFFPFDIQNCKLTFASWVHERKELDLFIKTNRSVRLFLTNNGVWNLTEIKIKRFNMTYEGFAGEYPEIQVSLILSRRSLFYVLLIIVPCTMLSFINLMVFILPTESGEKVSLGITNFLAMVLVQQLIGESIPPTSDQFPIIISYYFNPMIVIGCLSVMNGVITAYFQQQSPNDVPTWLNKLYTIINPKKHLQEEHRIVKTNDSNQKGLGEQMIMANKPDDDNRGDSNSNTLDVADRASLTGKHVASIINRLLMVVCIIITVLSMIVTAILFIVIRK